MPTAQRGTGFTNLQDWLGLNRGAAQGMATTLAADVNAAGQGYSTALQGAQGALDKGIAGSAFQAPTGPVNSTQAAQLGAQTYNGPEGFDAATMNDLYGRASTAQNMANATASNEGRQALLAKHYGPTTWGGGALDAALAGSGDAQGGMAGARGAYGRLVSNLQGAEGAARDKASAARDAYNATAQKYADAVPGLQQQEQQATDAATRKRQQQRQATQAAGQSRRVDNQYRNPYGYP